MCDRGLTLKDTGAHPSLMQTSIWLLSMGSCWGAFLFMCIQLAIKYCLSDQQKVLKLAELPPADCNFYFRKTIVRLSTPVGKTCQG